MKTLLFLLLGGIGFCHVSQTNPTPAEPATIVAPELPPADTISFAAQIQPILQSKCNPCHFPGGKMYDAMPFDRAATILEHSGGVLKRIKDGEEGRLLREFVGQAAR